MCWIPRRCDSSWGNLTFLKQLQIAHLTPWQLRWPDSRESIRRFAQIAWFSRIVSAFPNWTPFFCESRFVGLKIANRMFEAIRANRSHFMKIGFFFFLRIDSRESIRANRPDSRCESPGHLSMIMFISNALSSITICLLQVLCATPACWPIQSSSHLCSRPWVGDAGGWGAVRSHVPCMISLEAAGQLHRCFTSSRFRADLFAHCCLGIGNGVGRQGRGNQPPCRRYGTDTEIQYRLREPQGLAKTSRILSKREADTEFQYRPHIVDTDTDCGCHFCGCHFRDSYVGHIMQPQYPLTQNYYLRKIILK